MVRCELANKIVGHILFVSLVNGIALIVVNNLLRTEILLEKLYLEML